MRAKSKAGFQILLGIVAALATAYYYSSIMAIGPALTTTSLTTSPQIITSPNVAPGDWPTYHKYLSRSGFEPTIPVFSSVRLNWKSIALDGDVYAEPLIVGKVVLIATENNSLYELNADTGQIIWHSNFGSPVSGSSLPCGDIDPSGITGTPAIDPSSRTIFVVAFLQRPLHHELFAVDVDSGRVRYHLSIDPLGANAAVQQQRTALALANGYVYVAYGGLYGDCGSYHGWVVASRADGSTSSSGGAQLNYQVPTNREGGIWAPSGPAVNTQGDLFVATGNGNSNSAFDYGNGVIRLSADLKPLDWFAPSNWAQLNVEDRDLGSTGPIILNSKLLFQIGKEGTGYLLNADKLGGIGGQAYSAHVCAGAYGGLAYSAPYVLVPCRDGVVALTVDLGSTPSFNVVWRSANFVAGPPIIAGNAVWTVDVRNGMMYALGLQNGLVLFQDKIGPVTHFTSLSAGDGQIFVSGGRQVLAYLPQNTQNGTTSSGWVFPLVSYRGAVSVLPNDFSTVNSKRT